MAPSCEYRYSQLRIERSERVQSFRLTTSTPRVVVAIENRTQNDTSGPRHARLTLKLNLHYGTVENGLLEIRL